MNRLARIALSIILGITLAWGTSRILYAAIEPPEMQRCGTGQPLFDKPTPEGYAQMIFEQCQRKLDRQNILERFYKLAPWYEQLLLSTAFLADPLNLFMAAGFAGLAYRALKRRPQPQKSLA